MTLAPEIRSHSSEPESEMRDAAIVFKQTPGKVESVKSAKIQVQIVRKCIIPRILTGWRLRSIRLRDLLNKLDKILDCKNSADFNVSPSLPRANHVAAAREIDKQKNRLILYRHPITTRNIYKANNLNYISSAVSKG